jgi:hypothetical protein
VKENDLRNTVIVISVGILILIAGLFLISSGESEFLSVVNSVLAPLMALFLGIIGLQSYGKDSSTKDDRFYSMNLWLAIGLLMLSFAEIAKTLVSYSMNPAEIILIVSLTQLPGLLLWGIGILQYLRSLNSALGYAKSSNLWIGLFLTATLASIILITINTSLFTTIGFFENIVLSPIIVGLALFSIITIGLVGIFREGVLAKPLFLILGSLILYLVRCLLWLYTDTGLDAPTDGLITIESFILCGAALLMAKNL